MLGGRVMPNLENQKLFTAKLAKKIAKHAKKKSE
jgi:hypothetical protein